MSSIRCRRRAARVLILLGVCLAVAAARATEPERFAGRTLAEALRLLQQRGLPIVYSTAVVSSDMHVRREPAATAPRRVLDELLRPHGLEVKAGPGGLLQVVRMRPPSPPRTPVVPEQPVTSSGATGREPAGEPVPSYEETIVVPAAARAAHRDAISEVSLDRRALEARASVLAPDPLMAMHGTPRAAPAGDFSGIFAVRGSSPRDIAVTLEGVRVPNLQHMAVGVEHSAALSMVALDTLESAALRTGAYPRRAADSLGGEAALLLREGSRSSRRFTASVGGVSAAVAAEGPIGRTGRGSWLV
jgi:hypothetical protein